MPGTDPSTWSTLKRLNVELMQFQAEGARVFVEVNLSEVNRKFNEMIDLGVGMQDDLLKYTEEIFKRIVMRTPVRTGRARAAWHMLPPNTPGDSYAYTVPAGPHQAQAQSFDGSLSGAHTGPWDTIIGNNVDYIIALEAGHSRQAPNGMVAVTLLELTNALAVTIEQRLQGLNG